jgi:hypothetical protein
VNAIAACVVLLVGMTLLVVFTMVVENWQRLVQTLPDLPEPDPEPATRAGRPGVARPSGGPSGLDDTAALLAVIPSAPPAAGRSDGALTVATGSLQLRDAATADVLAALLFAAYASSRRAAADRASAWVTAAATPPSLDPARYPAGVQLRGRPARVAELLRADDGDATWVTLQASVDIAKGTTRAPVKQPTLAALVSWWEHGRSLPAVLAPSEAARIAEAVGAVRPQLDGTPWAATVALLEAALRDAADRRESLLVDLARADQPDRTGQAGYSGSSGSSGSVKRPSVPDGKSTTATTASGSSGP